MYAAYHYEVVRIVKRVADAVGESARGQVGIVLEYGAYGGGDIGICLAQCDGDIKMLELLLEGVGPISVVVGVADERCVFFLFHDGDLFVSGLMHVL